MIAFVTGSFTNIRARVITQKITHKLVLKSSAHSQSLATLQSLCLAFLSLEDGFRRLSAHRLDGEGWKEKCNGPAGAPTAKSSSAAVFEKRMEEYVYGGGRGTVSQVICIVGCYRVDGGWGTARCSASRHTKSISALWLSSPLPRAWPDTSRACSLLQPPLHPLPQIIDPLSGDYSHCHGGDQ